MIWTRAVPVMVPHFDPRELLDLGRASDGAVEQLEDALDARGLAPGAVVTARGRDAMRALLDVLAPRRGEVIVPAYTDASVYDTVRAAGHAPVLADVRRGDGNLDPDALPLSDATVAVVVTHLYGHPGDLDRLTALATERGFALIEDVAHALGARWRGAPVGSLGAGAFTSFAPFKVVQAHGGGAAWSADPAVAEALRARLSAGHGGGLGLTKLLSHAALAAVTRTPIYDAVTHPATRLAASARLDPKALYKRFVRPLLKRGADDPTPSFRAGQARLALRQLDGLEARAARRRAIADRIRAACADVATFSAPRGPGQSAELMLAAYAREPAGAMAALYARGVGALRSPMTDLFAREGRRDTVSGWMHTHAVLLPCHASLTDAHVERIVDAIRASRAEWIAPD